MIYKEEEYLIDNSIIAADRFEEERNLREYINTLPILSNNIVKEFPIEGKKLYLYKNGKEESQGEFSQL